MKVTFDPAKRDSTFKERGLAFEDAALVFAGDNPDVEDQRKDYREPRYQTVGFLAGVWRWWFGRLVAQAVTSFR